MLESLDIRNFQSHQHTMVEFAPTVTAIVGANNHGKSAIIRALQKVLRDEPNGNTFISDGAKECSITLKANGHTVVRNVRLGNVANSNEYVVDGVEFNKFGAHGIPEEVLTALDVTPIQEFGDVTMDLNFQHQLDDPFLVKGAGLPSLRGKVLGRVTGVDKAQRAVQLANTDIKDQQSTINTLKVDIEKLTTDLQAYEFLDDVENLLKLLSKGFYDLESERIQFQTVENKQQNILQIVQRARGCVALLKDSESTIGEDMELCQTLQQFLQMSEHYLQLTDRIGVLEGMADVDTEVSFESMDTAFSVAELLEHLSITTMTISASELLLSQIEVPDVDPVKEVRDQVSSIEGLSMRYMSVENKIINLDDKSVQLENEEVTVHESIHAAEEALGVCPLCERVFS